MLLGTKVNKSNFFEIDINVPAFNGPQPGPTQTLEADKNEIDFLNLLFSEELYSKISEETNAYAQLCIRAKANPGWYDTKVEEICAFHGCLVVIGIISAPAQDLYWSKDKLFHLSCIEERFTRTNAEASYFPVIGRHSFLTGQCGRVGRMLSVSLYLQSLVKDFSF